MKTLSTYIHIETPFNVDKLENLFSDYPNCPFVNSVIEDLCKGFWPFDGANWDLDDNETLKNYFFKNRDIKAIQAF